MSTLWLVVIGAAVLLVMASGFWVGWALWRELRSDPPKPDGTRPPSACPPESAVVEQPPGR